MYFAVPAPQVIGAFGLTATKEWYPHYFNTQEKLDYVGSNPETSYYCVNEMSAGERSFSSDTTVSGLCYSIIDVY